MKKTSINFVNLPHELLVTIFSNVSSISEVISLQKVCKVFFFLLLGEQNLWKSFCLRWWNEKGFNLSLFNLEWVYEECGIKSWSWFAYCFVNEGFEEGLSWRLCEQCIAIGNMNGGKLEGWGILAYSRELQIGNFHLGLLHGEGKCVWSDGERYIGQLKEGKREGKGLYNYFGGDLYQGDWKNDKKDGWGIYNYHTGKKFEGQYKLGKICGKGSMSWPNGFKYEGEWLDEQPMDEEASIHPAVIECIKNGVCTGTLTKDTLDFSQFIIECETCNSYLCYVCWKNHHSCRSRDHNWHRKWYVGTYCDCVRSNCVLWNINRQNLPIPHQAKKQKI